MAEQQAILVLVRRGWSRRRIARELGVHRETVSRYVKLASGEPAPGAPAPDTSGGERTPELEVPIIQEDAPADGAT